MSKLKYSIYLNKTSKIFNERGFECILAIVLALITLILLFFFPIAGIALMFFAYGFICVGTKSYLISIVKNNKTSIETVFSKFSICIKAFCLKVATALISVLWSFVFIIPGIISALNYSLASFVMADEDLSALECMEKSKKMIYGHRGEIFVLYLSYMFIILVVLSVSFSLSLALLNFFNIALWICLLVASIISLFIILVFIVPYYELMFANIYVLIKNEQKEVVKVVKTTNTPRRTKKVSESKVEEVK